MGEIIIVLLAFFVVGKILNALLRGFGKSDFQRDR